MNENIQDEEARKIAEKWCKSKGTQWEVSGQLGRGGTAPVFEIKGLNNELRALKIYDEDFSSGKKGEIEHDRIEKQLELKNHDCSSLVQIYDGGEFENRLFVLMSRAPGNELERRLADFPRNKIRSIVHQIAKATIFLRDKNFCHRDIKSANIFISEDFNHATLLDISVIRDFHDPVGVGTDHDGQLPVVATARYSPPEYLFRVIEPGPDLWHALDVYQLGALLHDLIMRKPMYEEEFLKSQENRYRFAWVVSSVDPEITAGDVDQDLIFLAKCALDKDWQRRSSIQIEEFLSDYSERYSHSLQLIGLTGQRIKVKPKVNQHMHRRRIEDVACELREAVANKLKNDGVTCTHDLCHLSNDTEKKLTFGWNVTSQLYHCKHDVLINLSLMISLEERASKLFFNIEATLSRNENSNSKKVSIKLPPVEDKEQIISFLTSDIISALGNLSMKLSTQVDEKQN